MAKVVYTLTTCTIHMNLQHEVWNSVLDSFSLHFEDGCLDLPFPHYRHQIPCLGLSF
jgi:hypothetical protein